MNKFTKSILPTMAAVALTASTVLAQNPIKFGSNGMGVDNFGNLISAGIQLAMLMAALITFFFLIWGGLQWITSGGDKAKYESARNRITAALIGLAIVAAAWALMALVESFFGITILSGFNIPTPSSVAGQ